MEQVVCEAGFLWRRVMDRLDFRLNILLGSGYTITNINAHYGLLRVSFVVTLHRPCCSTPK